MTVKIEWYEQYREGDRKRFEHKVRDAYAAGKTAEQVRQETVRAAERRECLCMETGFDGTFNHSAWTGFTFKSLATGAIITPCANHAGNYLASPRFKEVEEKYARA